MHSDKYGAFLVPLCGLKIKRQMSEKTHPGCYEIFVKGLLVDSPLSNVELESDAEVDEKAVSGLISDLCRSASGGYR